jgi:hypothetical protein
LHPEDSTPQLECPQLKVAHGDFFFRAGSIRIITRNLNPVLIIPLNRRFFPGIVLKRLFSFMQRKALDNGVIALIYEPDKIEKNPN